MWSCMVHGNKVCVQKEIGKKSMYYYSGRYHHIFALTVASIIHMWKDNFYIVIGMFGLAYAILDIGRRSLYNKLSSERYLTIQGEKFMEKIK